MAKVKIVDSSSEFLSVVEKSGVLSGADLESARKICAATDDPKVAAKKLLSDGLLTHWQATQLLAGFAGLVMGKYELLDMLSKGEFGRVYLAEHVTQGHKAALHILSTKNLSDPQQVADFLHDLKSWQELEHPHLVRVLDANSDQDRLYLVTEYVDGTDLQQRVEKDGTVSVRDAAKWAAQIAEALVAAHAKGLVHRDCKPTAVRIDPNGNARLQDFGFGHWRKIAAPVVSVAEIPLEALGFGPPEWFLGSKPDARGDVFGLGAMLYFLWTGRAPFAAANDDEQKHISETRRPVAVTQLRADVPTDVAQVCESMLALSPDDRPNSLADIARTLRAASGAATEVASVSTPVATAPGASVAESAPVASMATEEVAESAEVAAAANEGAAEQVTASAADAAVTSFAADDKAAVAPVEAPVIITDATSREAAAPLPTDFKIQKKRKITVADVAEADDGGAAAAVLAKRKRSRMIMLLGSVGAVALVGLFALIASLFRSDAPVAVAQQAATGAEATASAAPAAKEFDPNDPNDPENTPDPELTNTVTSVADAAPVPTVEPAAVTEAAPAATSPPPAKETAPAVTAGEAPVPAVAANPPAAVPAAEPSVAMPPANAVAGTAPPVAPTETPVAPATPTPVPPPAEVSKPAEPSPEPAPPPASEPKPEPKPESPDPKPAAKPPAPKPAPKKPAGKTFEIAKAVDLPRLSDGAGGAAEAPAKVLGKVNVAPEDTVFISMYGGDNAIKGRAEFALRNAQSGTAPRDWEFVAKDGASEMVVATLSLPQNELKFEWTAEGAKNTTAAYLQNCALTISAGQEKPHTVALRTVRMEPPAPLAALDKSPVTVKFDLDAVPDSASLRFEMKIPDVKHAFDSAGQTDATKGDQWIYLGESKEQTVLHVKVETNVTARGIQVTLSPHIALPNERPQRLTAAVLKRISVPAMQAEKATLQNVVAELGKLPRDQQQRRQNEINLSRLRLTELDTAIQRAQQLEEAVQKLASAQLHTRIFYDALEAQIDLVQTQGAAAPN